MLLAVVEDVDRGGESDTVDAAAADPTRARFRRGRTERGYGGGAAAIEFREATKRYAGQPRYALDHLTLRIEPGEICVLVGPPAAARRPR